MIEVLRTNDPVLLSWAEAELAAVGIVAIVFDAHASVIEGSVAAIERRLMTRDADAERARQHLRDARP